jgi:hypothetical protein
MSCLEERNTRSSKENSLIQIAKKTTNIAVKREITSDN